MCKVRELCPQDSLRSPLTHALYFRSKFKLRWILLSLLFCGASHAATCIVTEEQEFLWNEKYRPLFKVNTDYIDGSYSVEIVIPNRIGEREYQNSALFIDSLDEPSLFMPAEAFEHDEGKVVWYTVGNELVRKHFLAFSYGEGCGISVTVPVVFN